MLLSRPLVAAVALVAAAGCASPANVGAPESDSGLAPLSALATDQPLPSATLPRLNAEGTLSTDDLRGSPAVINFWATWCAFCVEEMPDLQALHEDLGDEIAFVGVDREDDDERALRLAAGTEVTYDLVSDHDGSFFRAVEARGMPTTLLVDADGVIRLRHTGPVTEDQLRTLIDVHLR
jgi:cytochrome c biogenesis protein CcmG, thiol:disulfide interchange protein DsbE